MGRVAIRKVSIFARDAIFDVESMRVEETVNMYISLISTNS